MIFQGISGPPVPPSGSALALGLMFAPPPGDIAGLKFRYLTYDVSPQCRGCAMVKLVTSEKKTCLKGPLISAPKRPPKYMRSFVKIEPSRIGDITFSFDIGKSCHVRDIFTSQMCLLTLFAKMKFSRKFPNLQ